MHPVVPAGLPREARARTLREDGSWTRSTAAAHRPREGRQAVAPRVRAEDAGARPHGAAGEPDARLLRRGAGAGEGEGPLQADQARRRRAAQGAVVAGRDAAQPALRRRHQGPGRLAHLLRAARRAGTRTATSCPVLAAEIPSRENGGLAADGKSVTWKLKQGVHVARRQAVHRRRRRLQLGVRLATRRPPRSPSAATRTSRSRRSTTTRSSVIFDKPTPFWADAFVGAARHDHPEAPVRRTTRGAKSREAPTNLKPVGTGPYRFVDFKPGDMVRGEINTELPHAEPAATSTPSR